MATFESGSSEQIRISPSEKEKFQKLQNQLYPLLEPIGQYVAARVVADPSILTADFEAFGEAMLTEMYQYAGMELPQWVKKSAAPTSIEDMDRDIKEEIRTFLYKVNLDAYAKNIGRTGILRTGPNGNDYPDYDEKTNVSAYEKIEISIKSGLISWQIFKDTTGIETVTLTTAFAKEISRIVGEAYNLQSIGNMLAFKYKVSRIGSSSGTTLVTPLGQYMKFLIPEFEDKDPEEQSEDKQGKPSEDNPMKIREDLRDLKQSAGPKEEVDNGIQEAESGDLKGTVSTDPILQLLIDCTYNSSKKFKTVTEIWKSSPDPSLEQKTVHSSLERLVKEGIVLKNGAGYAARIVVEGKA
jgi:hypothetical protein